MNRKDWLRGWFAGLVLGAAVGFAAALALMPRAGTSTQAEESLAGPARAITVEDRVWVQDALVAGRAFLRLNDLSSAAEVYARVLRTDCDNREAKTGLRAALSATPFERERVLEAVRRECNSRS